MRRCAEDIAGGKKGYTRTIVDTAVRPDPIPNEAMWCTYDDTEVGHYYNDSERRIICSSVRTDRVRLFFIYIFTYTRITHITRHTYKRRTLYALRPPHSAHRNEHARHMRTSHNHTPLKTQCTICSALHAHCLTLASWVYIPRVEIDTSSCAPAAQPFRPGRGRCKMTR